MGFPFPPGMVYRHQHDSPGPLSFRRNFEEDTP
jgi:hypothetical protein